VSDISKGLDEMVTEFRTRPLEREYPVIWVEMPCMRRFVTSIDPVI